MISSWARIVLFIIACVFIAERVCEGQLTDRERELRQQIVRKGGDWETPSSVALIQYVGPEFGSEEYRWLRELTRLDWFVISSSEVDDDVFCDIAHLDSLQIFQIYDASFTGAGFRYLRGLEDLRWLLVEDVPLTDEGIEHISRINSLETLDLLLCSVEAHVSVDGLKALKRMSSLRRLHVSVPIEVPQSLVQEIREALPDCRVWISGNIPNRP